MAFVQNFINNFVKPAPEEKEEVVADENVNSMNTTDDLADSSLEKEKRLLKRRIENTVFAVNHRKRDCKNAIEVRLGAGGALLLPPLTSPLTSPLSPLPCPPLPLYLRRKSRNTRMSTKRI